MTDLTYYAWAPIVHKNKDNTSANLMPGDVVPSELLNSMDAETVKIWKDDGVIRTSQYPKGVPNGLSVRTHLLRKANEDFLRAQAIGSPQVDTGAENPQEVKPNSEQPKTEGLPAPTEETPTTEAPQQPETPQQ